MVFLCPKPARHVRYGEKGLFGAFILRVWANTRPRKREYARRLATVSSTRSFAFAAPNTSSRQEFHHVGFFCPLPSRPVRGLSAVAPAHLKARPVRRTPRRPRSAIPPRMPRPLDALRHLFDCGGGVMRTLLTSSVFCGLLNSPNDQRLSVAFASPKLVRKSGIFVFCHHCTFWPLAFGIAVTYWRNNVRVSVRPRRPLKSRGALFRLFCSQSQNFEVHHVSFHFALAASSISFWPSCAAWPKPCAPATGKARPRSSSSMTTVRSKSTCAAPKGRGPSFSR